jgi:hypothetical protein
MNARNRLLVVVAAAVLCGLAARPALAAKSILDADQMRAALRTASVEEDGFIDMVVEKVDQGGLPVDLVKSTFQWARKKPAHRFQYFKRALMLRAKQQGIEL